MCLTFFMSFIQTDKLIIPTVTEMSSAKFLLFWRFWFQNHLKLHLKVLKLQVCPCGETFLSDIKVVQGNISSSMVPLFYEAWCFYCGVFPEVRLLHGDIGVKSLLKKPKEMIKTHLCFIYDFK